LAEIDQAYLAREDAGAPKDKVDAAAEKVRKERVKFEEDLLAFLTPEERAGYERVPVAEREAARREGAEEWRWGDVRELPGVR
jgi:Spy/CpxP family protein refolding chaperone